MNFSQEELINMAYVLGINHQRYPNTRQPALKVFEKLWLIFDETGIAVYKKKIYNHKSVSNDTNALKCEANECTKSYKQKFNISNH